MKKLVKNLFGNKKKGSETSVNPKGYEDQTVLMKSENVNDRMKLAENPETHKEILYYLAEKDPDPRVRKAVAENTAMPMHASRVLANDDDQDVRLALAGRLVHLMPDLNKDKQSQLYAFAVQALGTLALDEVLKVRVALSSTLKDHAHTPPKVAAQLARDVEREVSEPILRFCAALSDHDLLDILKAHPASWVIEAVASRPQVSSPVSEAVIDSDDRPAGVALIENEGADITENLLHHIVDKAKDYPEWQKPMATRSKLPVSIVKELASFVDASVRDLLMERDDFDGQTAEEIAAIFRRRMEFASEEEGSEEPLAERITRMYKDGVLNEDCISDALGMRDKDFVVAAIAKMIKVHPEIVEKVFDMKAPKSIVALSWHAGLSMRMALRLQKELAYIPHNELIYPRDGTDYPLSDDDLTWQLDFLGLK